MKYNLAVGICRLIMTQIHTGRFEKIDVNPCNRFCTVLKHTIWSNRNILMRHGQIDICIRLHQCYIRPEFIVEIICAYLITALWNIKPDMAVGIRILILSQIGTRFIEQIHSNAVDRRLSIFLQSNLEITAACWQADKIRPTLNSGNIAIITITQHISAEFIINPYRQIKADLTIRIRYRI